MRLLWGTVVVVAALAVAGAHEQSHEAPKEALGSVVGVDIVEQGGLVNVLTAIGGASGPVLRHRRSKDGGQTWTPERPVAMHGKGISNATRGLDPQIAAAGDRLFVVWTTPGQGMHGVGALAVSRSMDGGTTWTSGPNPADDGTERGHAFIDAIAEPDGALTVVWLENRGTRGLQVSRSPDMGASWGPTRTIDGVTCECCWNELHLRAPGDLLVLYRDKDPRDMAIARTTNGGASWTRLSTVGDFAWGIEACPFTGGALALTGPPAAPRLHSVVFSGAQGHEGVSYLSSTDLGRSWTPAVALGEGHGQHADMAVRGDSIVVVYDRADKASGQAVVMRRSDDAGKTWGPTTRLSSPKGRATFPRIVQARGRWLALWNERVAPGKPALEQRSLP